MMSYFRNLKDIFAGTSDESVRGNVVLDHQARIHCRKVEHRNTVVQSYTGFKNNCAFVRNNIELFSGWYQFAEFMRLHHQVVVNSETNRRGEDLIRWERREIRELQCVIERVFSNAED